MDGDTLMKDTPVVEKLTPVEGATLGSADTDFNRGRGTRCLGEKGKLMNADTGGMEPIKGDLERYLTGQVGGLTLQP